LEVSEFLQCFQKLFRHFAAFRAIEITTEFPFVGMTEETQFFLWIESTKSYTRPNLRYCAMLCDAAIDRF